MFLLFVESNRKMQSNITIYYNSKKWLDVKCKCRSKLPTQSFMVTILQLNKLDAWMTNSLDDRSRETLSHEFLLALWLECSPMARET